MPNELLAPLPERNWDRRKARHLMRRAGFGIPYGAVSQFEKMGLDGSVRHFLDYKQFPDSAREPDFLKDPREVRRIRQKMNEIYRMKLDSGELSDPQRRFLDEERRKVNDDFRKEERQVIEGLKRWWLKRMLTTQRPLEEKMTLFWHGHFATSAEKVDNAYANHHINKTFRDHAVGNFKTLTTKVGQSPAMIRYLDNDRSTRRHPNENWARELMELFALGEGNYTEKDIKNSARAFTGWTSDGIDFHFNQGNHDPNPKNFMGRYGNFDGYDILDIIFEQKAPAEFLARKLWTFFAYEDPEDEIVEGLAKTFRDNDYELTPLLDQMFRSTAFYGTRAVFTQIKSPVQLSLTLLSHLRIDMDNMIETYMINGLQRMGQDLFYPPNVKGWDGGRAWIDTNKLMMRYNLANFLVQGVASEAGGRGVRQMLQRQKRASARAGAMGMDGGMMGNRNMAPGTVGDSQGPKGFRLPIAPFDAAAFFTQADGLTIIEIADFLADYFYGAPINAEQHRAIVVGLAGKWAPSAKLKTDSWDVARLYGTVHLMLSSSEYQLC